MEGRMLFLVCMSCTISQANSDFGLSAAAISAAGAAISAGTSLVGTTLNGLMNDGYKVTCGIEIENWTRFPLTDAVVRVGAGAISVPPIAVLPGKKEAMVARKTSDTATGTYGTVSWLIETNPRRRVVVMWSAPYDFNAHSNWMAVGLTSHNMTQHAPGNQWFDQMYFHDDSNVLRFERKEYWDNISPVNIMDDRFRAVGNMGSSHKAQVKVILRPLKEDDLAAPIRALLGSK